MKRSRSNAGNGKFLSPAKVKWREFGGTLNGTRINLIAGLRVALERRPEGPRLGEQVVDVVGEERPDRPVYMAGDPRTPFTPLPRGRSAGPEGERVYTPVFASVVLVDSRAHIRRMETARG